MAADTSAVASNTSRRLSSANAPLLPALRLADARCCQ
jgi:hypothetical protein